MPEDISVASIEIKEEKGMAQECYIYDPVSLHICRKQYANGDAKRQNK